MKFIWQRYFLTEFFKIFFLSLSAFSFLYVLIDYASHTKSFQQGSVGVFQVIFYYFCELACQSDLLIPVAILLSTVKVLTTAHTRYEMIALCTGGISLKRLPLPLLSAGFLCGCLLFCNFQFLQPQAFTYLERFERQHFKEQSEGHLPTVQALTLVDNSLFIYQSFDSIKNRFCDTYWLKNSDEIYHIQFLYPYYDIPKGESVDHLKRDSTGQIHCTGSYDECLLPDMRFETQALVQATHPPKWQSFSQLFHFLPWKTISFGATKMSDREAEAICSFFYKLVIPFTCLLAVIAPAPFCLAFTRKVPLFAIYACSLCGILTFFTLLHSSVILGESQVIPPLFALFTIPMGLFLFFGWKYAKL